MKKVKLGEVLSLKKGKKATVLAEQTTLSQRYIQIDDLRNNNNLKFTESLNMTEALPDDILIAWDGANAGTVGYGLSGAVGSTITVLKKNERYKEKIISDYLGVFLESKSQYLRDHSTGATIPHLNKNILLDLQLELLGIEEQENIICILNTIKRLITKRKLQLDELNLLVKSRFNEMFGDVILNEKEWKVSKWNEILTIRNGKNQKQVEDADGKFPIYGSGGIMGYAKDWIVKKNSVIIGRKGNINKPILVRENFWNVDTAFGLEPVLEKINSEYLLDLFGNCKKCYTIFMETVYDKAQKLNSKNFKLLIGVKKETFQLMLEHLNSAYQIQHRKGGRPRSLPMEDQLIMTLRYLRYYPTQRLLAFDFGVGVATVNAIITWVEDTLRASGSFDLDHLEAPSAAVAIDVTESPIQRPKKNKAKIILVKRNDTP
ncbi:type I restriction-modification system S subunit [Streptococcus pneumoniae]|uniref:restriction endonuclease subunit S n=26 Tax=Streptococcus TaxID=1301 RepID=UPI0005DF6C52|nr:type I restriction-modification system S subunit [Streptococcus pneumoniae]CIX37934.1 type I restriction-modification system S subunit [Streptococcus pneumoniae]